MAIDDSLPDSNGYQTGDEREFPDGSLRRLDFTSSGVRRWLGLGQETADQDSGIEQRQGNPIAGAEYEPPEGITLPQWMGYNKYLTEDNPFLGVSSLDAMNELWFSIMYDYQERIRIYEEVGDTENLSGIKRKMTLLDNYYLALLMYKITVIVEQIKEWEPEFDYEQFQSKSKSWNDLFFYLEGLKDEKTVNYSELYDE